MTAYLAAGAGAGPLCPRHDRLMSPEWAMSENYESVEYCTNIILIPKRELLFFARLQPLPHNPPVTRITWRTR